MRIPSPKHWAERSFDVATYARRVLKGAIRDANRDTLRVRAPKEKPTRRRAPQPEGMHVHLYSELFIQLSGTLSLEFPSERVRMAPGEAAVVPPAASHRGTYQKRRGEPFYHLVFGFGPKQVWLHLAGEGPERRPLILKRQAVVTRSAARLSQYLAHVAEASAAGDAMAATTVRGLILAVLAGLVSILDDMGTETPKDRHPKIRRCRELVIGNLVDPELSVSRLASWLECSADYLSYLFHKETGQRLAAYINKQRIALARGMLEDFTLRIAEIARACGYAEPSYFARVFREDTGCTPREYRKSLQRKRK